METSLLRLHEGTLHDVPVDLLDLDVHLEGGDTGRCAGDLEVHVAQVILVAEDVREDDGALPVRDEAHRDARHRRLERRTGVQQGQGRAADGRLRRRAVRLERLGDHANRVREIIVAGQHRLQGALSERAVAHLTPPRTAKHTRLADREGREVVVEHERLLEAAAHPVDGLLVEATPERRRHHRLGLAPSEESDAVGARHAPHLAHDRTDLVRGAAIDTHVLGEHPLAQDLATEIVQDRAGLSGQGVEPVPAVLPVGEALGLHLLVAIGVDDLGLDLGLDLPDRGAALVLRRDLHRIGEPSLGLAADLSLQRRRIRRLGRHDLRLPDLALQFLDHLDHGLQFAVGVLESREDLVLGNLVATPFDHHDGTAASGDDQLDVALLELLRRRVDDVILIHPSEADCRDRTDERKLRNRERRRGTHERAHVGRVIGVAREHRRDHVGLVVVAVRKQRADRAIDEARDEHLAVCEASFAFEEATGDLSSGRKLLDEVDGEWKEVDAGARLRPGGGDEHRGVAVGDEHGARRLLGDASRLEMHGTAADRYGDGCRFEPIGHCLRFSSPP